MPFILLGFMKIYISGLYSGTNPQPGVGIARSLRQAYPDATLVGVEYSNRCSGIHWQDFDEIWLQRPWEELSLPDYAENVRSVLDSGALWISSIDLEIMWFGDIFPNGHPNLLTPPLSALRLTMKPEISAHKGLPVEIPTFVTTDELSDWELHAFCRQHDWKVWLKGPYYEAVQVRTWADLEAMRGVLSRAWATDKLFLQTHVTGYEESVTISAYRGELLKCVLMRKRDLTELSKTWAGDISDVPENFAAPLRKIVKELNWTGGAEFEMVHDAAGKLYLLEVNPRFPAWIHGATITGHNMPAALVEGVTGVKARENQPQAEEFTRVVMEIPVRPDFPLPPLPEPYTGAFGHSMKHPSGLIEFAQRLHKTGENGNGNGNGHHKTEPKLADVPATFLSDLSNFDFSRVETPSFLFLEKTAEQLFARAEQLAEKLSTNDVAVRNAYSIKTNPDERLIALARGHGFLAEAISLLEINKAMEIGFEAGECVLNGPGKWWRKEYLPNQPMRTVFSDSIADLNRIAESAAAGEIKAETYGIRLRTPNIPSRFGIPMDTPENFRRLVESVGSLPRDARFGVHFHMASSNVGVSQWWSLFETMLRWCSSIEALTGRTIETLDVGGGWFPDDWQDRSDDHFSRAVENAKRFLPHVREIISEPGKALAQPSMAVAMRILEIQDFGENGKEVVVDGSIAELPMYFFYPHRILYKDVRTGMWQALGRGKAHLLGRLCMEHDIVATNVELPDGIGVGDTLVFCDAGAYDRSMSYVFGRG